MEMDAFTKWLLALWLALPTTALNYWLAWNRLPARIAVHYDASGRANSWASPGEVRTLSLWVLVFVLAVVTGTGYLVAYLRSDRAKPALILIYLSVGLLWVALNGFVWFNLTG
jgi:uncharacterized membrane protein